MTVRPLWLVLVALAGCKQASAAPESADPALHVRTAPVERSALARTVRVGGTLHHKSEANLAFNAPGVIARLYVEEGEHVRRGHVLATLDTTQLAANLTRAQASLVQAERDQVRAARLRDKGAATELDFEAADTGLALARANQKAAAFDVRRATIVAPDDGVIDRRLAEVGEVVAAGAPVYRLGGLSRGAVVQLALTDRDALDLTVGQSAQVTLDARPDRVYSAKVSQRATVASPSTGTFDVEVKLDAPDPDLLSGMTAKVTLSRPLPAGVHVPLVALVDADGSRGSVYVPDAASKVRRVPVRVLGLVADRVLVDELPGDVVQVVAEGAARLRDGETVVVTP